MELNRICDNCGAYMSVRIEQETIELNGFDNIKYIDAVCTNLLRIRHNNGILVCNSCNFARRI